MKIKTFLLGFISVYLLLSVPAFLGIGSVIDWVPEATFTQKFTGIVIDGLTRHALIKSVLATIISLSVSLLFFRDRVRKRR
ncbi:hypothetical protein D3D03_03750 [Exiguobacterium sp. RIT452]|uniref:hypothetical protein n=1 Tax=Exiguobacterium sp. RIT452 TaxID=2315552 RepID=UPI000E742ABA|nr:hypothetical protein [Exiguobacterium sp. RIT452]RJP02467.1 hypothetical protein D3D03_03750 [Exiguobacterium sp. RIT452]